MPDTKWEYMVLSDYGTHPLAGDLSSLNARGKEGREAVGCYALKVIDGSKYWHEWCVLLKRPKRP